MPSDPIRIRITVRESGSTLGNAREDFWNGIREEYESERTIASLEAKLRREFGTDLRRIMLREFAEPFRAIDSNVFGFDREILRDRMQFKMERNNDQFDETIFRLLEQKQQLLRESPSLRNATERLVAAAGITFSARIAGYSSLVLDLFAEPFKLVASAFENDFDSFRVFLEVFAPVAFADVFTVSTANKLDFEVHIPISTEKAFRKVAIEAPDSQVVQASPQTGVGSRGRERAEWIWKVANGSLLIPVLLALLVVYYGLQTLNDMSTAQYEAVKPTLEHQLKLLEEDRKRLFGEKTPPAQTAPKTPD